MILRELASIREEGVSHDPELRKKMVIRSGEIPCLKKLGQIVMKPGQVARAHAHAGEYEIFLVEAGEGTADVDGEQFRISQGTCITFEPDEVHEIVSTGPGDLVLTYLGIEVSGSQPSGA